MKKFLLLSTLLLLIVNIAYAGEGDIVGTLVKESGAVKVPNKLQINFISDQVIIQYRWNDADGNFVEKIPKTILQNIADDPETPEDETDTSYDQFMTKLPGLLKLLKSIKETGSVPK